MDQHRKVLAKLAKSQAPKLLKKYGLVCQHLQYGSDSETLYIAKTDWTNRFDPDRESTIGIFCSIWVSTALLKKQQFAYNIHSKQLAKLPGYKLAARKFADEFRLAVNSDVSAWPNIRMDYGPGTLLQGNDECALDTFADKVTERVEGFVSIHKAIDLLLDDRRV